MGRFSNVKGIRNKIKNEILDKVLSCQDLLKYIYYNSSNPLSEVDIDNTSDMLKTHIFTKPKISDTIDGEKSLLIIDIKYKKNSNIILKDFDVTFNIMCHNDLVDNLYNGDDRLLCIADLIDDLFNGQRGHNWIGKSISDDEGNMYVNPDFLGFRLVFNFSKIN